MSAEHVKLVAGRSGVELSPDRAEIVTAEVESLWRYIGALTQLDLGATEPMTTFPAEWEGLGPA